jgi:hypothetical protein
MTNSSIELNAGLGGAKLASTQRGTKEFQNTLVEFADSPSLDASNRLRVSNAKTLFDSKQIVDNAPLFWDDQEVSGSGTTSTYDANTSSTILAVSNLTAGKRVRQTYRRFNYESGKSHLVELTGTFGVQTTGVTRGCGYGDDNNGIVFVDDGVNYKFGIISSTSGSPVASYVSQASWSEDRLDGSLGDNNPSGLTLDGSKIAIVMLDFEWYSANVVRVGLVIDGNIHYVHKFKTANVASVPYMTTPNLPCRYWIENDGAGAAANYSTICVSVKSEGGSDSTGITTYLSTSGVHLDANTADVLYALIGVELKSTHVEITTRPEDVSVIAETTDGFEWVLLFNPVVAGTFTYSPVANSALNVAKGVTANTVTGGTPMGGGWAPASGASVTKAINSALALGASIAGVTDKIVLCVRPTGANADINGSLTMRELI